MELTRKEAIENFREQYRYIAEQYRKGRVDCLEILKEEYIRKVGHVVKNNCYLCEYARHERMKKRKENEFISLMCSYCPINFTDDKETFNISCCDNYSYYSELQKYIKYTRTFPVYHRDNMYMSELALKIANLPEKE